jgi:hypothetical protein
VFRPVPSNSARTLADGHTCMECTQPDDIGPHQSDLRHLVRPSRRFGPKPYVCRTDPACRWRRVLPGRPCVHRVHSRPHADPDCLRGRLSDDVGSTADATSLRAVSSSARQRFRLERPMRRDDEPIRRVSGDGSRRRVGLDEASVPKRCLSGNTSAGHQRRTEAGRGRGLAPRGPARYGSSPLRRPRLRARRDPRRLRPRQCLPRPRPRRPPRLPRPRAPPRSRRAAPGPWR